jgi:hypothetical protein
MPELAEVEWFRRRWDIGLGEELLDVTLHGRTAVKESAEVLPGDRVRAQPSPLREKAGLTNGQGQRRPDRIGVFGVLLERTVRAKGNEPFDRFASNLYGIAATIDLRCGGSAQPAFVLISP